ncbi:hypothetical protein HaLaN_04840 [Haematococcus lacustris]|uniref:Uncharacterized protein n=1 Tax=Haematococcus lacustris TaxID=44745 RepID=A0A699YTF9_HAELA|nr:hypothetical protein HaLaN_04840 [Haematococcus lacustris]
MPTIAGPRHSFRLPSHTAVHTPLGEDVRIPLSVYGSASGEPVAMMAVAVLEKLGPPGVRYQNREFELKALLRQQGLGAVVRAPVDLE